MTMKMNGAHDTLSDQGSLMLERNHYLWTSKYLNLRVDDASTKLLNYGSWRRSHRWITFFRIGELYPSSLLLICMAIFLFIIGLTASEGQKGQLRWSSLALEHLKQGYNRCIKPVVFSVGEILSIWGEGGRGKGVIWIINKSTKRRQDKVKSGYER